MDLVREVKHSQLIPMTPARHIMTLVGIIVQISILHYYGQKIENKDVPNQVGFLFLYDFSKRNLLSIYHVVPDVPGLFPLLLW